MTPESRRGTPTDTAARVQQALESMLPITLSTSRQKRMTGRIGSSSPGDGAVRLKTFSGNMTVNR